MSTKAALDYDELKPWRSCVMCDGRFVEHSYWERRLTSPPPEICWWCFSRKPLVRRYMALYEALMEATADHPEGCENKCCRIARMATQIMNS